jgi:pantothenate kinase-related protein Tda10
MLELLKQKGFWHIQSNQLSSMSSAHFEDDKAVHCVPFILQKLKEHQNQYDGKDVPPFFVGVNGVQGAGKTTLVRLRPC